MALFRPSPVTTFHGNHADPITDTGRRSLAVATAADRVRLDCALEAGVPQQARLRESL